MTGNYPWYHSDESQNPDNGETINIVSNGRFEKRNIRFEDEKGARINETFVYFTNFNSDHQVVDPASPQGLRITPDTYLQFKIDEMWINQQPPSSGPGYTTAYQYLSLIFNVGSNLHRVQFSLPGQGVNLGSGTSLHYTFGLGGFLADNIYNLFERQGVAVPEPLYLHTIHLNQRFLALDDFSEIEHIQQMTTDVINIVEGYNGFE